MDMNQIYKIRDKMEKTLLTEIENSKLNSIEHMNYMYAHMIVTGILVNLTLKSVEKEKIKGFLDQWYSTLVQSFEFDK